MKIQIQDDIVCIILEKEKSEAFMSIDGAAVAQIKKEDFDVLLTNYLTFCGEGIELRSDDDRDMERAG